MRFTYCPHCGEKLIKKEIGDEGLVPFCEKCNVPLWDMFNTAVICAVVNEFDEIALLRQDYVSKENYVCVAGYIKTGESAEDAAAREIKEELGLDVIKLNYIRSYPYDKKEMLMLGFKAEVRKAGFMLSREVDSAEWVKLDKALPLLRKGGIAWRLTSEIISGNC